MTSVFTGRLAPSLLYVLISFSSAFESFASDTGADTDPLLVEPEEVEEDVDD